MSEKHLDWQSQYAVIKDRGAYILQSGMWSDCKFFVGRENDSPIYFSAHKLILAMASPVFEAMFYGSIAEADEIIHIPDVQPESFEAMLQYIYTDQINVANFDDACALYYCANKYILPHLTEGCVKYFSHNLKPENVCRTYEFAKMFGEYNLMDECIQVIQCKTKEVLNNKSFNEAKLHTVMDIFSLIPLNIDSELDLFIAAERYAMANSKNNKETSTKGSNENLETSPNENQQEAILDGNEEEEDSSTIENPDDDNAEQTNFGIENNNEYLKDAEDKKIFQSLLDKILLLTLTPQEFADSVARSPYISQSESFGLLMNIASNKTDISVPEGFNILRKPRYKLVAEPSFNQDLGIETSKTRSQTVFRFTVPNFQKTKHMSLPFYVRKLSWRIAVNPQPDKNEEEQECLGIFLYCEFIDKSVTWTCNANAVISLISNKSNAIHVLKKVDHVFTSVDKNRGSIIPMDKVMDPKYGYVKNNCITIEVNLTAEEPSGI